MLVDRSAIVPVSCNKVSFNVHASTTLVSTVSIATGLFTSSLFKGSSAWHAVSPLTGSDSFLQASYLLMYEIRSSLALHLLLTWLNMVGK